MIKIKEMIQQGRLADAISYLEGLLREDPLNVDYKSTFIELLCINGELERADKMLNNIVQKHPDFLIGASNLRQLIELSNLDKTSLLVSQFLVFFLNLMRI